MYRISAIFTAIVTTVSLLCSPAFEAQAQQRKGPRTTQTASKDKKKTSSSSKRKSTSASRNSSGKARTADEVKQARTRNAGEIRETRRKMELNTRETEKRLNQLALLEGEIDQCNDRIGALTARVDSLNRRITVTNDSISTLDNRLEAITDRYVKAIRRTQGHGQQMSDLAFIFSSESFSQAWRRMRSLRQFSKWRQRKSQEITQLRTALDERRKELTSLKENVNKSIGAIGTERATLVKKQASTNTLVDRLRREGGELRQIMSRREKEAASLDAELDRIIAEEARKAEEARRKAEAEKAAAERKAREEAERKAAEAEKAAAEAAAKEEERRIAAAEAKAEAEARKKAAAKAEADKKAAMEKARDDAEREKLARKAEEKAAKEAAEQVKREREAARKAEEKKIKEERAAARKKADEEKKAARERAKNGKPVKHTGRNNGRGDTGTQVEVPADKAPTLAAPAAAGSSGIAPAVAVPQGIDFEACKGRLPFPVSGHYTIVKRFGRQKHPTLPHVETTNSGIDMATTAGAQVKSVFDGEVSAVFRPDGYNNVVVIRHGKYMTVYANLGTISVSTGQKVKAGQSIGTVYTDPNNDNRSVLHFEIRNQRQKENPELWLKK